MTCYNCGEVPAGPYYVWINSRAFCRVCAASIRYAPRELVNALWEAHNNNEEGFVAVSYSDNQRLNDYFQSVMRQFGPPQDIIEKEVNQVAKRTLTKTIRDEMAEVAARTAVASLAKSARKPLLNALKNSDNPLALQAGALLETELGQALLMLSLGTTLHMLPDKFGSAARMEQLGYQLRSQGLQKLAEPLMEALAEPLMEALAKPLALYAKKMDQLESSSSDFAALQSGQEEA